MADFLTPEKRSALMATIKGKNTKPELLLFKAMRGLGLKFRRHARELPGRPDALFSKARIAVFVDGDFWHGWRYPQWKGRLSKHWQSRIETNRARDQRNFRRLRNDGWVVLRFWEHQVLADPTACASRVKESLDTRIPRG